MIRADTTNGSRGVFLSTRATRGLTADLPDRSVVRVSVVSLRPNGTVIIRAANRTLVAAGLGEYRPGSVFDARVSYVEGSIVLEPLRLPVISRDPLDAFFFLNLPKTEVTSFLVSFFSQIGMKLDTRIIGNLDRIAGKFPGKERRAAEAAAILSERGIEVTEDTVARLVSLFEGRRAVSPSESDSEGERGSDADFCAHVNRKMGQDLHWIVVPFSRHFGSRLCSGSVRFLVDQSRMATVETRVTALTGDRAWEFTVVGESCSFTASPPFSPINFGEFVVYLRGVLSRAGIFDVSWRSPGLDSGGVLRGIDVEA